MRTLSPFVTIAFCLMLISTSCVTKKKLTYLQYSDRSESSDQSTAGPRPTFESAAYKIMPYDILYIRVITPDPQWSELFNIMPVGAGGAVTEESAGLFGYIVDGEGNIDIPFIGKVEVEGKSLNAIKSELDIIFKNYVTDAAITIRLVNNNISILGEVNMPGRYPLTKDRVNIFEAISMAGDINEYGNRTVVRIIRPSQYGPLVREVSLIDRSILSSEYYYIMPNDIIYAIPDKGRTFQVNSLVWSLFLTTVSTTLVILSYFRTL